MNAIFHVFGEPFVEISGERVKTPLRKTEAVLFYIFFERRAARETLKLLFWGDKDEEQASGNLRNALYLLRRALHKHFVSEGRVLSLQNVFSDLDQLEGIADPKFPIDHVIYEEPLRGLDGIGSPEFDAWLVRIRVAIVDRVAELLRSRITACYERGLKEELTDSFNALLFFDPFDEDSVLELMEAYVESGHTAKAVSLFGEYSRRVRSELGIEPSPRALGYFAGIANPRKGVVKTSDAGRAPLPGDDASLDVLAGVLGVPQSTLYGRAGMKSEELQQHLREMRLDITLNHILFPLLQDRVLVSCRRPFADRQATEVKVGQVQALLAELNHSSAVDPEAYAHMEAQYLEIWGGYLINWGEYRLGRTMIERSLKMSRGRGTGDTQLFCLEHLGHYYLQTDSAERLRRVGREILRIAHAGQRDEHKGLALRFIGMSCMLERDFARAERIFQRSSELFGELAFTGRHYTLSALASHCYIGEMWQWQGRTGAAMERFVHCIKRCEAAGLFWGRSHFHAHAADAALDMGDDKLAARYVDNGVALFESSKGGHCGALLYSLKAMLDAERGDGASALAALEKGDFLCAIGKRSWRAAQMMAYAAVARMHEQKRLDLGERGGFFSEASGRYARTSAALYDEIGAHKRAGSIRKRFGID